MNDINKKSKIVKFLDKCVNYIELGQEIRKIDTDNYRSCGICKEFHIYEGIKILANEVNALLTIQQGDFDGDDELSFIYKNVRFFQLGYDKGEDNNG